jgi:endonuclease G
MIIAKGGDLAASAFLLSQQEQVLGINRIEELTDTQAAVFQISLADLTRLTKLDFGKLTDGDTKKAARKPRKLERLEDMQLAGL